MEEPSTDDIGIDEIWSSSFCNWASMWITSDFGIGEVDIGILIYIDDI